MRLPRHSRRQEPSQSSIDAFSNPSRGRSAAQPRFATLSSQQQGQPLGRAILKKPTFQPASPCRSSNVGRARPCSLPSCVPGQARSARPGTTSKGRGTMIATYPLPTRPRVLALPRLRPGRQTEGAGRAVNGAAAMREVHRPRRNFSAKRAAIAANARGCLVRSAFQLTIFSAMSRALTGLTACTAQLVEGLSRSRRVETADVTFGNCRLSRSEGELFRPCHPHLAPPAAQLRI